MFWENKHKYKPAFPIIFFCSDVGMIVGERHQPVDDDEGDRDCGQAAPWAPDEVPLADPVVEGEVAAPVSPLAGFPALLVLEGRLPLGEDEGRALPDVLVLHENGDAEGQKHKEGHDQAEQQPGVDHLQVGSLWQGPGKTKQIKRWRQFLGKLREAWIVFY